MGVAAAEADMAGAAPVPNGRLRDVLPAGVSHGTVTPLLLTMHSCMRSMQLPLVSTPNLCVGTLSHVANLSWLGLAITSIRITKVVSACILCFMDSSRAFRGLLLVAAP